MRVGATPENLLEWLALAVGYVPRPLLDTQASMIFVRSIQVAAKLGIFDVLASCALTVEEIAERCHADQDGVRKLLAALAYSGYVEQTKERYRLGIVARRWLISGDCSLRDYIIGRSLSWDWLTKLEDYVRTGQPVQIHQEMSTEQWAQYQKGMSSLASISGATVARNTPLPPGARKMLDIGGAHGLYSVMLCRRHLNLHATILELPEAIEYAAPILAEEGMGDRVVHKAGDALKEDFGIEIYDLILISNVIHHFSADVNRELFHRLALALRPGGYLVVQGSILPLNGKDQPGRLWDLFFALTSDAGSWTYEEIAEWQREANLMPRKPIHLGMPPGSGQQFAVKSASYKRPSTSWFYEQPLLLRLRRSFELPLKLF